jgi:hypothetical protein
MRDRSGKLFANAAVKPLPEAAIVEMPQCGFRVIMSP